MDVLGHVVQRSHSESSVEGSDGAQKAAKSVFGGEAAASLGSRGSAWVTTCKVINKNKCEGTTKAKRN